jgi:hypothetical protein
MLNNQKKYICLEIVEGIVKAAADDLFNTPRCSVEPTDSFAEDFEVEGVEIQIKTVQQINQQIKDTTTVTSFSKDDTKVSNSKT